MDVRHTATTGCNRRHNGRILDAFRFNGEICSYRLTGVKFEVGFCGQRACRICRTCLLVAVRPCCRCGIHSHRRSVLHISVCAMVSGYTGHCFNDWNHCDATTMIEWCWGALRRSLQAFVSASSDVPHNAIEVLEPLSYGRGILERQQRRRRCWHCTRQSAGSGHPRGI